VFLSVCARPKNIDSIAKKRSETKFAKLLSSSDVHSNESIDLDGPSVHYLVKCNAVPASIIGF
jgi:hypothetical protein